MRRERRGFALSREAPYPLAIDIGATKTVVAVLHDGAMKEIARFPTESTPVAEVDSIASAVKRNALALDASVVGIGAPGPLDPTRGIILAPPNLPGWRDFPLTERLSSALDKPVRLENDANAGALGEAEDGSGRGFQSVYYLTISTGIGSGLVIDGRIFGGHRGIAGEVYAVEPGHYAGHARGDNLNELSSGPGMVRRMKRKLAAGAHSSLESVADFDAPELLAAADAADPVALSTLDEARNAIAGLLTSVLFIVAPHVIVLAGGLCTENRWFVEPVRERVREWMPIPELAEVPIQRATLWDRAVLFGAARMVMPLR